MKTTDLPRTAECGSTIATQNPSTYTVLASEILTIAGKRRHVELYHLSAGYVLAGSCLRLQPREAYGFTWGDGRATYGRSFSTLDEAKEAFSKL